MRARAIEQNDAGDRYRQAPHQAIDDALQHRFEPFALQRLTRHLREDFREHRATAERIPIDPGNARVPRHHCLCGRPPLHRGKFTPPAGP